MQPWRVSTANADPPEMMSHMGTSTETATGSQRQSPDTSAAGPAASAMSLAATTADRLGQRHVLHGQPPNRPRSRELASDLMRTS